ncbi:uncharacterized protein PHACADRAFT_132023 [Phanerochaete carnosa HHB-10118-sp]|uniref:Uncharacterized protein n=1 Tax=Phanerochaete carnosa (strain HHB-10118-sp) TaxID=650164 RepID=K5UHL1_PHACS|nr:uncharacterized protein PHACADRAFT_132023 [Phanerochaete carnosa HHB-10118-sp]EKM49001.1 hypothetical protein PHACADRAFT_132023 [Phanerochaete carnosa HHB-10118-sp]
MSPATGADLSPETLSSILDCLLPLLADYFDYTPDRWRRLKHELVAPSLVCKHWAEAIRPILFRRLALRNVEDVQFLKDIVYSPRFAISSLFRAVKWIEIHQEATEARSWLHHVHGLSTRLQKTRFKCIVMSRTDDLASMTGRWAPFDSIPSVTPSYVRLSVLTLNGLVFTSTTELARLVDNFSTLEDCFCDQLTFLDPLPVFQSRRIRRRAPLAFSRCRIQQCKGMAVSVQAALAADILAAARRMGLDEHTWDTALQALLVLVPNTFDSTPVYLNNQNGSMFDAVRIECRPLGQGVSINDSINIDVKVCRPSVDRGAESPFAHISSIALGLSFADVEAVDTFNWDVLRVVVDSPHMRCLRINYFVSHGGVKRILCSVLRRTQLTWALESGKLQFGYRYGDGSVTSADILSVPTEHTVDDTTITLDIAEQAEWLLYPVLRRYPGRTTREEYVRQLVAERTSRVSKDTGSEIVPSTADSTPYTAVD